jgi:hypothetical protein
MDIVVAHGSASQGFGPEGSAPMLRRYFRGGST